MNYKKIYSTFFFVPLLVSLLAMLVVTGCSDDDEQLQSNYGYVQFKLYKSASSNKDAGTRAATDEDNKTDKLDVLNDARKVELVMQFNGSTIHQTLPLNSYNADNAEFGLRSEKLKLMAGNYTITGYYLYDKLDRQIFAGIAEDDMFTVSTGGLNIHSISVEAVERGLVNFKLVKEFAKTRANEGATYPFANIKIVDIVVKNLFTQELDTIKKVRVKYVEDFTDSSADEGLYPGKHSETSYAKCDTIVWLKAGSYQISSYTTYSDKNAKKTLETASVNGSKTFIVKDNEKTEDVEVPVRLSETAEYIKDYLALREIWEALSGKEWKYFGEAAPMGANWNFNKDLDMWGDQPGVSLNTDGRVIALSLAGFGAKGVVPDAIGQLTALQILSLGAHDEKLGGHLFSNIKGELTEAKKLAIRMDYENKFLARDVREGLSDILQEGINMDKDKTPIKKSNRISLKDIQVGSLTNQITGISRAMMRLVNLQQFFIANSPITVEGFFRDIEPDSPYYAEVDELDWSNLNQLTDIEIYNCRELTSLPLEMLTKLPELQALNIACNQGIKSEDLKNALGEFIAGNSGAKIQMLYLGNNNLVDFPDNFRDMVKLGMLDCVNNKIKTLKAFGKDINLTKLYMDNNQISKIDMDGQEAFCGFLDVEGLSFAHNLLTEVPDIFNARSNYIMGSVDFSYNQITGFENGDNHRGINASTVTLSNNRLKRFPSVLFKKGSPISTIMLAGNGMTEIKEGDLKGSKSNYLTTIDLTFNKLTSLPDDFRASTLPYLEQIDLSYNSFSKFPTAPLNVSALKSFGIRHQRDDKGNRTLREWPTGLYTCPSLLRFFIGSNDIRKIDDTISPNIYIFEIKDNPNISIDMTKICPYIQAGAYVLIYDKTQDIRGCDALDIEK